MRFACWIVATIGLLAAAVFMVAAAGADTSPRLEFADAASIPAHAAAGVVHDSVAATLPSRSEVGQEPVSLVEPSPYEAPLIESLCARLERMEVDGRAVGPQGDHLRCLMQAVAEERYRVVPAAEAWKEYIKDVSQFPNCSIVLVRLTEPADDVVRVLIRIPKLGVKSPN